MRIILALSALVLVAAAPARYAVVCTAPCQGQDASGNPVQEPAGYVQNVILWDGVAPYTPGPGLELKPAGSMQIGDVVAP